MFPSHLSPSPFFLSLPPNSLPQIRGHIAGSPPPFPRRPAPCIFNHEETLAPSALFDSSLNIPGSGVFLPGAIRKYSQLGDFTSPFFSIKKKGSRLQSWDTFLVGARPTPTPHCGPASKYNRSGGVSSDECDCSCLEFRCEAALGCPRYQLVEDVEVAFALKQHLAPSKRPAPPPAPGTKKRKNMPTTKNSNTHDERDQNKNENERWPSVRNKCPETRKMLLRIRTTR